MLTLRISCNPASIYLFKVNNGNNGTVSEILTIKTPKEVFLLLTTSRFRTLCTFLLFLWLALNRLTFARLIFRMSYYHTVKGWWSYFDDTSKKIYYLPYNSNHEYIFWNIWRNLSPLWSKTKQKKPTDMEYNRMSYNIYVIAKVNFS